MPRASQVKTTKSTTWKPTKVNTPTYLPSSSCQRATGLASRTDAALGSRNEGRKPAVQTRVISSPNVPATPQREH